MISGNQEQWYEQEQEHWWTQTNSQEEKLLQTLQREEKVDQHVLSMLVLLEL